MSKNILNKPFYEYYEEWIELYKKGAIREVTLKKYYITLRHLKNLAPELTLSNLNRIKYQQLVNKYAENHQKQTTLDFHHQVRSSILDAYDDGLIERDPTRKIVIKGISATNKKAKFLNQNELRTLINTLTLGDKISLDWLIYLLAKTGLRFGEALALTPNDFDIDNSLLSINKTWDYKSPKGKYQPTKNKSSNRKIKIDWKLNMTFARLIVNLPKDKPIFVNKRIHNSTVNQFLAKKCKEAKVQEITLHSLRHTHASILLYAGVSVASVAKRLGHANMATTQKTYLHIIQELETKDNNKIMEVLSYIS